MSRLNWTRSSYCSEGNACLYVASKEHDDVVLLTESAVPGAVLRATPRGLRRLICQVKAGRLDSRG
ncbi:DUF397 domain-containing protein [Streptomyces sp. NPDC017056]|uniref:DUF397 domain-containing protein n=1 Tax=Streptomyces sp. NPDC017056 TaxID=3364973 RepID=UPI0037AA3991